MVSSCATVHKVAPQSMNQDECPALNEGLTQLVDASSNWGYPVLEKTSKEDIVRIFCEHFESCVKYNRVI